MSDQEGATYHQKAARGEGERISLAGGDALAKIVCQMRLDQLKHGRMELGVSADDATRLKVA